MNTGQINQALANIQEYKGTYPADRIPVMRKFPCSVIINTDRSNRPGEHWVAVHIKEDGHAYYFDSFGFPVLNKEIQEFITKNSKHGYTYSSMTLQHPSADTCGAYCIEFVRQMATGSTFADFINQFSKNLTSNEHVLKGLLRRGRY